MADEFKNYDKFPILDAIKSRWLRFTLKDMIFPAVIVVLVLICVLFAGLFGKTKNDLTEVTSASSSALLGGGLCTEVGCMETAARAMEYRNTSVDPCEDFFEYACGNYLEARTFKLNNVYYNVLGDMYQENKDKLIDLMERPISQMHDYAAERKVKQFFQACNDMFSRDKKKGLPILNKVLPELGGWKVLGTWQNNTWDFNTVLKKVQTDFWVDALYRVSVETDWYDTQKRAILLAPGGLGNWMYWTWYVNPRFEKNRQDYKKFIRRVGSLLARDAVEMKVVPSSIESLDTLLDEFVNDSFAIESKMAQIVADSDYTEDRYAEANKPTLAQLTTDTNNVIDWTQQLAYMFSYVRISGSTKVVLTHTDYFQNISNMISSLPAADKNRMLHNYLIWRVVENYISELSWDYIHANREVFVDLYKRESFLGLFRYCFAVTTRYMGDALGSLYINHYFSKESRETVHDITDNIRQALKEQLEKTPWMDGPTKQYARERLDKVILKMGYPDWMDNVGNRPVHFSQRPVHFSQRPVHFSQRPVHFSQRPVHFSQRPAHFSQRPAHFSQRPVHFSQKLVHFSQRPAHLSQRPVHFSHRPVHFSHRPVHFSQRPVHFSQRPVHFSHRPVHFSQRPVHFSQRPVHFSQRPVHFSHRPVHFSHRPVHFSQRPVHFSQRPVHFSHRPVHFSHRPIHFSQRPAHLSQRPVHFSQRPVHFSQRPVHFSHRPVHFSHRPVHFSQRPVHFSHRPVHFSQRPVHFSQRPVHFSQKLVHFSHRPVHISQRPVHFSQRPVHFSQRPVHFSQRPVHFSQRPVHFSQRPVHFSQRPVHFSQRPVHFSQRPVHFCNHLQPVQVDQMYNGLSVNLTDHFTNMLSGNQFHRNLMNEDLNKASGDREEWTIPIYSTTMYVYLDMNEISAPAGILQFPVYSKKQPHSATFGSFGSVLARFFHHVIDEWGRKFDKGGNYMGRDQTWWSNKSVESYEPVRKCVENVYNVTKTYRLPDGTTKDVRLRAKNFVPFAISWTNGVRLALIGYRDWMKNLGIAEKLVPGLGLTNEQTLFLAHAQTFCYDKTSSWYVNSIISGWPTNDVKINMALGQLPEFSEAFKCKKGSQMYHEERCDYY
nr:endothelin-converting enzyme-like 1 [Biomphalaria glabrata]